MLPHACWIVIMLPHACWIVIRMKCRAHEMPGA
jgi:hypothetical protein